MWQNKQKKIKNKKETIEKDKKREIFVIFWFHFS